MNKHFIYHPVTGLFLIFLISCSVSETNKTAAPEVSSSPKPGDCISCHDSKGVIPKDHVDTKGMMGDECGSCHKQGVTSLWTKIPLGHIHQLKGVSCEGCHENLDDPKPADSTVCQKCHGDTRSLIEAASELKINPHFSPHEGKISDCNKCHHQHKSSENNCAHCHGLEYKVP